MPRIAQLEAHFKQVGILAVDPETQQPRVKLYRDEEVCGRGVVGSWGGVGVQGWPRHRHRENET